MGKAPMVVVGSPEYFARHGRPELPADLLGHRCIRYSLTPVGREWRFHVDGRPTTIPVNAQVHLNNGGAICAAAVGGLGVARLPLFCVEDAIDSGRLEVVLADFAPPPFDVVAIYPPAKKLPAKTRAFIDFIAPRLRRRLRQKVS
jgi:DNA-binding transcriptional LysR family regulator